MPHLAVVVCPWGWAVTCTTCGTLPYVHPWETGAAYEAIGHAAAHHPPHLSGA